MSTPARHSFALVSIVLIAAAIVGCGKKEEEPVVMTLPSATAVAPVKAAEDPPAQPQQAQPIAAASTGSDAVAAPATATPPADAPKAAPPQPIDGCCSALAAMIKDAKVDAVTKSKAGAAAAVCNANAPLVKAGKSSRATALTRIKATMSGSAPSACN